MAQEPSILRECFPLLASHATQGHPFIYLDTASTCQIPAVVLDAMQRHMVTEHANVHRGMYPLAERSTEGYEAARRIVQAFLHAAHSDEIVFTRGTTESINLVARSFGSQFSRGGTIVLSLLEHHSNIVAWQQLACERGLQIRFLPLTDQCLPSLEHLQRFLREDSVQIVAVTGQSNVIGVRPPLPEIIALAHAAGVPVLVDAAQLVAHRSIDVQELDIDFLAFSGHKIYGPTGIGVLYAKRSLLHTMPPFLGGGMMIRTVTVDGFDPADAPQKFEAGTPPITEAIGLGASLAWLSSLDRSAIAMHEDALIARLFHALPSIPGLRILGPRSPDAMHACLSMVIEGCHPHDLAELLGRESLCVRGGHHCTQPLHRALGAPSSLRASVGLYSTDGDIDAFVESLSRAVSFLRRA